ncbi:MAG: VOC family protein [Chitinophagales bacterium]|nr:VOC family protein [Chitinophagales bacterium]
MQKITPFLWFDGRAKEAMDYYITIFKNSRIINSKTIDTPQGPMVWGSFSLEGQEFHALDGGPMFQFSQAISFYVNCETQAEVNELWEKLSDGGEQQMCGWLKDKFGISWQIIPLQLTQYMHDPDPIKAKRVMQAMLQMKKIEIADIEAAYQG